MSVSRTTPKQARTLNLTNARDPTTHAQHEFVRVADDFRYLVIPFTATAFLAQLNLLLCSWSLLLKTRARLHHHGYLYQLGQQLRRTGFFWRRLRAARGGLTPEVPAVAEALHSAAERARAKVRNRRRRRRQHEQEQQ